MKSNIQGQSIFRIPEALRLGHDEVRAELVRATSLPGKIGDAASLVADLCLPHFEREEQHVYPVFGMLREFASGEVRSQWASVLPLVADFKRWQDSLDDQHQSIAPALHDLLLAAYKEDNREMVEFTYNLRMHERLEDQVLFPTVLLIGRYVEQRLGV